MRKITTLLLGAAILLVGAGCSAAEREQKNCPEMYEKYATCFPDTAEKACIDQGGVPVMTGEGALGYQYMIDCKFK